MAVERDSAERAEGDIGMGIAGWPGRGEWCGADDRPALRWASAPPNFLRVARSGRCTAAVGAEVHVDPTRVQ